MAEMYAESPLATHTDVLNQHSVPGQIHLAEVPFKAQVNLRVDPKSPAAERIGTALGTMLPNQPGEVVTTGELSILWLGPDEWLLVGAEGTEKSVETTVNTALEGDHASVVNVSANRTIVSVTGPKARELLNKGCALDLHPWHFPGSHSAQTLLARTGVVLVCRDAALPSYWLIVRSSYARYLADWLCDAAVEYREWGGGT